MAAAKFEVAYDGEALREHAMDVQDLAPALLALGNLIRDTNAVVNADKSKVKVLVQSDFEHKCFNVALEITQTFFDHARSFLADGNVKTAEDILKLLGLIGVPSVGTVFGYLLWRKGRASAVTGTTITDASGTGVVQLHLQDGSIANINQTIYMLAERPEIKRSVAGVLAPTLDPGIDRVVFREGDADEPSLTITKVEADQIRASCEAPTNEREIEHEPQPVVAHLRVRSPVFEPDARQWRFFYGEENIVADISETNIAANAIARGGVMLDDLYTVRLEITEHETEKGRFRKSYKIKDVISFKPAAQQRNLFIKD
jgi:hypothetical protein